MASKDKITILNRKRGSFKSQLTKIDQFLVTETVLDIVKCQTKLEALQKIKCKLEELKYDYFEIVEDDDVDTIETSFSELEEEIERLEVSLKTILTSSKQTISTENSVHNSELLSKTECVNIKLPEIPLPKFAGQYQEWHNFKSQFENVIHSNYKLSDAQKLFYLKSTLIGPAADIVTSDDSYDSLYKALSERFENKRLIVNSHFNEILSLEIPFQESAKGLRNFVDCIQKHVRALKTIGLELNDFSEALLINLILKRLDKETKKQFELSLVSTDLPAWKEFIEFLEKRCLMLENIQANIITKPKHSFEKNQKGKALFVKNDHKYVCVLCKKNHPIFRCESFLSLDEVARFHVVKQNNCCINCLSPHHKLAQCPSTRACTTCNGKHNTLLHRKVDKKHALEEPPLKSEDSKTHKFVDSQTQSDLSFSLIAGKEIIPKQSVLLSTCVLYIKNASGNRLIARGVIDTGSQQSFISTELANRLNIKKVKNHISISGINGCITQLHSKICTDISNKDESYSRTVDLLITPKITDWIPSQNINVERLNIPSELILADPKFWESNKIDILLSAQFLFEILLPGKYSTGNLIFQNSKLGYLTSGVIEGNVSKQYCGLIAQIDPIEDLIERFWEIEDIKDKNCSLSEESVYCEEHFKLTHKRDSTGRFIVEMPMKEEPPNLGESKHIAEKRLNSLNRRLEKNPHMKELYSNFINEYENLNHMERVNEDKLPSHNYYLPHHCVLKSESKSTPLRVVFNASSPSSNGNSLNDVLMKGDIVEDIFDLILRFRTHKFAFTFDVQKMFRQILITPSQRDYLRILWTDNITNQLVTFKLKTVTYGTACAPFLAIRTLQQLATDEATNHPLASEVVLRDMYMDDCISGSKDIESAQILQQQLKSIFANCGMSLHKWTSNSPELLNDLSSSLKEHSFSIFEHATAKTLGMNWLNFDDLFVYKIECNQDTTYTKRTILSLIAKLYDPLGLLGPVISKFKIFMQSLWLQKLNWEDTLPQALTKNWCALVSSLKDIEQIKIPRWILVDNPTKVILHCFSDASEAAYGAVIYIQCILPNNSASVRLVTSKSRVSPLKTISIPRLELCGCLLAVQLKTRVEQSLNIILDEIIMHTDSSISLAWIRTPPHQLKTFIANRVGKIQQLSKNCNWQHVSSKCNPADLISRGMLPNELVANKLWWQGPTFLQEPASLASNHLDDPSSNTDFLCELKDTNTQNLIAVKSDFIDNFLKSTNDYRKLIHVFSFVLRFIGNCRKQKKSGELTAEELNGSELKLISLIQKESLNQDYDRLSNSQQVKNSNLKFLSPFIDENQKVIRVGGRLRNSELSYDKKFPLILPKNHNITKLILLDIHERNCHVGAQTLLHLTRQKYWPIGGRNLARSIVHNCVICAKFNPQFSVQKMGDLPAERCIQSFPFNITGVDFCGPFQIKNKFQRKGPLQKIYIAIFICFVTRAVHFEIVTDLTSDSFIAALKRFMSRRGKVSTLFTDNGRNFVGANNELKRLFKLVSKPDNILVKYLSSEAIRWNFIPPRSPHFGGLWEAGVKSFKFHLLRAVGCLKLNFEEFLTVTNQIEGILNSRPMVPLSSDANEEQALTPGHFLIGRPILAMVEPNLTDLSDNSIKRWQRVTKIVQYVWQRWHRDYLNHLQQKNKWFFQKQNISVGDIVLVKEDNLPINNWLLGKIEKLFFGKDNNVRVCLVKTKNGIYKRSINKLAVLPVSTN